MHKGLNFANPQKSYYVIIYIIYSYYILSSSQKNKGDDLPLISYKLA